MRIWAPILVIGFAGCGDSPARPAGPEEPIDPPEVPLALTLPTNSGAQQVAPVASYLPAPLVVRVLQGGAPVAGVPVRWASTNPTARVEPLTEVTDADGYVSARFFTATTSGDQNAIAILGNQWLGIRVRATPGTPARLRAVTSLSDSVPVNTFLYLRVKVEDQFGNGIPGVAPEWSMPQQDNVGFDNSGRPSDGDGVAFSFVFFAAGPQSAVVTSRLPAHPAITPITFSTRSY